MDIRKISLIRIAAISFLLIIFWSASAFAQPNITGFSGSLTDGSTITINGNSFGANGPNIVVFDDFEGGTNGNDINSGAGSATIGKWDRIGQVACKPKYDNAFSVSGSKSFKADYTIKTNTGTDAGCSAFIDNLNTGYIFLSYWFYLPTTSAFPCYNGGICNWKPAWLYGTNTQDDDQVIPAGFGGTTESLAEWAIFGNDTYPYPWPWNYFTFNMNKGNWYRIWAYIHATNDATGTKELWVMSTNASIPVTKKLDYSNMQIFNDTDSQFEIFSFSAWARWCNNCTESAPRFDDVYLATGPNARARVEIGNSATYNTCTNLTIATVTSWSDTSITATIRQGSFSNLNNAYLYVIDANGNVNTNGYLLSDGGGGGTGGDTPPPSSSSGGDSGGGSGGSGCGFVKEINGKGQGAKGEMLSFAIMLIITLAGIALVRKAAVYKGSKGVEHIKRMTYLSLLFFVIFCIPVFANAADYYVATNGNDTNPGTIEQPFRTTLKGLQSVKNGDIIYIRGGAYRLMEESTTTEGFAKPNATQTSFVTIQNYNNEKVRILGSVSSAGQTWVKYNPDIWQIPADFMPNDPKGMFNGEKRIAHVMKWIGGVRSHGDISQLTNPGQWTKADATGNGCTDNNANCNIYLFPNTGEDPNTQSYELSQRMFFWGGSSYMIVRGLEFAYTQNAAFTIEGGRGQIIENNIFSHNSNGNDNAYSVFISYGGGAVIRNNKAFDSEYWGGTPNSKGITLMCMDPNDPSMIEGNEIYDIIGQGIATKSGVSNIIVRRNYVHNVGSGIEPPGPRCHWTKPDCQKGDSEYYPGGGWQIYENTLVNNTNAISIKGSSEAGDASHNNKIYNNVF